jgi:hypothetical protein
MPHFSTNWRTQLGSDPGSSGIGFRWLTCFENVRHHLDEIEHGYRDRFFGLSDCRFGARNRGAMEFLVQDERLRAAACLLQLHELLVSFHK